MKSEAFQQLDDNKKADYEIGEEYCFEGTYYVTLSVAEGAVKTAMHDERKKSIDARIATCPFQSGINKGYCVNGIKCDVSCDEIKKFVALI